MILLRLIPFFLTMAFAATLIVLSEVHSWSSSATTWGLTAIFAGSTVIDLAVSRWRERSTRHRGEGDGTARPAK